MSDSDYFIGNEKTFCDDKSAVKTERQKKIQEKTSIAERFFVQM